MSAHHTPGPWVVVDGNGFAHVLTKYVAGFGGSTHIASCAYRASARGSENPAVRDARLIAAAPELLDLARRVEALFTAQRYTIDGIGAENALLRDARAAIARAKGLA